MRNKKLLFILIPVIIVVVVLLAGIVFLSINGSAEKIFKTSVSKVFRMIETTEEEYSTVKGTMNLTANIESDDENVQALNTMLGGAAVEINMEADTANMIVNEKLNVKYNNESLLNASILLQDEKGYVYLPDWLDKYIQLPEEYMEYSELTEYNEKIDTLDQDALMEAIEEELIVAISKQELVQEKTTLVLNGQETKVTASTLSLNGSELLTFTKDFTTNLKENEKFQKGLGIFKEDYILVLDEALETLDVNSDISNHDESNEEFRFTIYTKGFLNEFVGVSAKTIDNYWEEAVGVDLLKQIDGKYEFVAYEEFDGEREETIKVIVEDKKENKNKGTATITIIINEEQLVLLYNYETKGEQTTFTLSTEIEGVTFKISGNAVEKGNNVKGNFVISLQEETMGKIDLNFAYDFTYGVQVQKVNTSNAVLIDELSEEDQTALITNLQNSTLYQIIEQSGLLDETEDDYYSDYNEPQVSYAGYTVKYSVPEGFEASEYSSEDLKMYMDDNFNSIDVSIEWDTIDEYINYLDDSYVLTSDLYENQKISDTKTYTVNGKEFKLRTITYNDEYDSYINLYFAYELDNENCYVVEVETVAGNISMQTIEKFLDITVALNGGTNTRIDDIYFY